LSLRAVEYHVAMHGHDTNVGSLVAPLRTIQRAGELAQPGDTITVHAGIYREWINPPRGGTSDAQRITYQAAAGENVVITGSEPVKGWVNVSGDTWKGVVSNKIFGSFHPFIEKIDGDWFDSGDCNYHRGCVYLGDSELDEAPSLDAVLQPVGKTSLWYAKVDGVKDERPQSLMSIAWFKTATGSAVPAVSAVRQVKVQVQPCAEGGQCLGSISHRSIARFNDVDFGTGTEMIEIRAAAAAGAGGIIEVHLDHVGGELIGRLEVLVTGGDQEWRTFRVGVTKTVGIRNLALFFKPLPVRYNPADLGESTAIWAQFPGVNPNDADVEFSVRPTVFTPKKANIDYITVRGFKLRNAATTWAAPTAGQVGLITAYWCKGWVIEDNEIYNSRCCGVALGKYSDEWDGMRGSKEGYDLTIADALQTGGWTKERIGSHVVRNNHIHHCGQTGIVGSLGCAFSAVTGNVIHDINQRSIFAGAEMAGIKFHGAIDVTIAGNHIYRCGQIAGIWLDWMCQGAQVTGNLMHDNNGASGDLFLEVQHGPMLLANNLFLSSGEMWLNAEGMAFAQNLFAGPIKHFEHDKRRTPFHHSHCTAIAGVEEGKNGDHRFYNNLFAASALLQGIDNAQLPCFAAGNVFVNGATPSKFDQAALHLTDFDTGLKLTQEADGWYLDLVVDPRWSTQEQRPLVQTAMLGKAVTPALPYEDADGSPLQVNQDYSGATRPESNPFPGPFENLGTGKQKIKVWPKKSTVRRLES